MQKLQEQIRKLEQDVEKLRGENKAFEASEAKAKDALAQQISRNQSLQKELEEAKAQIAELQGNLCVEMRSLNFSL